MNAKPPDWLMYAGLVATLVAAVAIGEVYGGPSQVDRSRPATGPGPGQTEPGAALPPPSPFDPTVVVDAPTAAGPGTGTAFSVSPGGVWLTARHVVEGCARTVIIVAPGQGVAAEVRIDPRDETAVLVTQGGAPALPMAPRQGLGRGMLAFQAGFPHGQPGEVASRLMRREVLVFRGRRIRREPVLAWEDLGRRRGASRSLAGLSGAPTLDGRGQVIGVTIAQSRRGGRIYTTTPGALRAALARAHIEPSTGAHAAPMTPDSYGRIAARLRRDLRIVPVVCLTS